MTALNAVITRAGLAYMRDRMHSDQRPVISHIAVGDASPYRASATQAALRHERARLPVAGFRTPAINVLHITALYDDAQAQHEITEVGLLADDGTLLAVYAEPGINLGWKSQSVPRLLAYDWIVDAWDLTQVQITVAEPELALFFGEEIAALAGADITAMRLLLEHRQRIAELERQVAAQQAALARAADERAQMRRDIAALTTALSEQLGLIVVTDALATSTATQLLQHEITEH